jgi:hypothetical protein
VIDAKTLMTILPNHIGKAYGVTAEQLATECLGCKPTPLDLRSLRSAVQELRNEGVLICASPGTGYFIAEYDKEVDETCEFLYDRAMSSLKQISRMKKIALPDLRGQLRLPT